MNEEVNPELIKSKLSGKYADLYSIYEKLREELFKNGQNIKIILKTIYMRVDFDNDTFGVIAWTKDALEFALPTKTKDVRILSAKHLKWKQLPYMVRLTKPEDVDDFVSSLIQEVNATQA